MKHWKFNLTILLIGWPAMIAGYLWAAIKSGFECGAFHYAKSEKSGLDAYTRTKNKEPS